MSDLPKGWTIATLDALADVLDFEREPINSSNRKQRIAGKVETDLYPYYGATGQVGLIDSFRSEGQRVLLGEDAAPFLDPSKNKAYLANGRFWVNNHAHILTGAGGMVDNNFLCHQLNTVDYHPFVTGSTRLKLTSSAMKQIPMVVAPAAEQTRIVAKLEELLSDLNAAVAELNAAQKKLGQYRESLLKAAVEGALTADWRKSHTPQETGAQLLTRILTEGLESVLFVLRQPPWKSKAADGDPRFWNARGVVRDFLSRLYDIALAPVDISRRVSTSIWNKETLQFKYLYVKDITALQRLVGNQTPARFFQDLESTYVSELIEEVRIRVRLKKNDGSVTFRELSEASSSC